MHKKQIILLRHPKVVDRTTFAGTDFEIPLSEAGEQSLKVVANYLRLIGVKPERILSSSAVRARDAAIELGKKFHVEPTYHKDFYPEVGAVFRNVESIYLPEIQKLKKDHDTVLIVGHNNDLTDLCALLSGESVPSLKKWGLFILSLPEGMDWKGVTPGSLKFIYYLTPHFLRLEDLV